MIKKLCSYPGCHKVVEAGVKYCDKHRETDRKKYREYKQRRMRDEQEARRQQFYNSKAWEQFRAAQAAAQLGIDITIKSGAAYGGLSSTRGKAVPAAQLGGKRHTVDKVQTNKGVQEAKLKEINSWVAVASLTAV